MITFIIVIRAFVITRISKKKNLLVISMGTKLKIFSGTFWLTYSHFTKSDQKISNNFYLCKHSAW